MAPRRPITTQPRGAPPPAAAREPPVPSTASARRSNTGSSSSPMRSLPPDSAASAAKPTSWASLVMLVSSRTWRFSAPSAERITRESCRSSAMAGTAIVDSQGATSKGNGHFPPFRRSPLGKPAACGSWSRGWSGQSLDVGQPDFWNHGAPGSGAVRQPATAACLGRAARLKRTVADRNSNGGRNAGEMRALMRPWAMRTIGLPAGLDGER